MEPQWVELPIATREGVFRAHYSAQGLAGLDFPNPDGLVDPHLPAAGAGRPGGGPQGSVVSRKSKQAPAPRLMSQTILRWHRTTVAALEKVLAGRAPKVLPPLDWTGKTEFQQSVWRQMLKLGTGQTKSYGEIAAAIGKPKAVRAVGGACGANPIPVLVPCHRVLAAHHQIGGFSSGLDWKRRLLAREGVKV